MLCLLLVLIMCLHPKLDVNSFNNDTYHDWEIDDNCDYIYDIDHVQTDDFVIIQTNIRGILSKRSLLIDLLESSVKNRSPDVVLISETWLTPNSPELVIPGYDFVHKCRQDKKGGGVGILVSNKLRYTEIPDLASNMRDNETISIEIALKSGKKCIISSMYRAPNTTPAAFQGCYESIIFAMKKRNPHSIIVGLDHNLDFLKSIKHSGTNDFIHSNLDMGMIPTVTKPTRITKSSATLIDNIIVSENLCGSYHSNVLINDMSDHMPTICILSSFKMTKKEPTMITSRDTRPRNIKALKEHLNAYDWTGLLNSDSLDVNVDTLSNVLSIETDHCTPVKTRKIHGNKLRCEPWLTAQLKHCIDKSKKLYRFSLRKNSNSSDTTEYVKYKKTLRGAIRTAKRLYHNNKCEEYRNNSKKLWQVVNEVIGKNRDKSTTIDYLTIAGIREYGAKKISNSLAKYFSKVGQQYVNNIPNPKQSVEMYLRLLQRNHDSLYFHPCDRIEVTKLIYKLPNKNSHGYDNISNIMLKVIANELVTPLCIIINQSLETGQFLSEMKLADVVPLFKSKDRSLETNYRPISLLSTMSKILEKVVYNRVYNFLDQTGQISSKQYGFRAKHSCEHAVGQLVGTVLNKEASWLYAELCAHKMWSLRCHGSHVFPIFLEMSGKSSLPCLCLRCHGSHVFPVFPEMLGKTFGDVGEDNWRCWGRQEHWERHSRLSGRTSRRMGMTLGRSGMMGKTSGMTGKTSGRSGKMRKTSRVFPVFASRCHGSHVFPIFLEMSGKSSLPCLCLRCHGSHVFPVFPEMLGKTFGDVGEDNWRCWGRQEHWERHSRLSGRTSRMGMTLGRSGMMGRHQG